jgi:acid stress chaperone HdeB
MLMARARDIAVEFSGAAVEYLRRAAGTEASMKGIRAIVAVIALGVSPAFAAEPTIPLASMTCKQFVDSPKETVRTILLWMMGYLQDSDEPAEIDFSKLEDLGQKLAAYCGRNPTHAVMTALDKVSEAADDPDVLKSIVGLWTYPGKEVWIRVRQDGSATQCRIGPDGTLYFSTGAFRAPNVLAWEKNWGEDKVVREKDTITLTGKFGAFSYKLDNGGRPPERCASI